MKFVNDLNNIYQITPNTSKINNINFNLYIKHTRTNNF